MKKVVSFFLICCMVLSAFPVMGQNAEFTYENLENYVKLVNDYWIASSTWTPGYEWDTAAYYTGCMDAYYLTGIEKYKDFATTWAERNRWKGHGSTDTASWNNSNVYHADNQTCFQVYIDLYNLDPDKDEAKIARVKEITDAQMATGHNNFWTWCDALYMAMPVYSKMYALTGDEKYLDALYNYFKFCKERMYDGNGGIKYEGTPANLFFRDPGYISSKINGQKNIWARGVGWVMAAFARIFEDIPEDWEHYNYFLSTYLDMADACIRCVQTDSEGRMFWTQSMLANYPTSDVNPYGYETSGTAFITYSLYYGINAGLLDESIYLPVTEGCLRYLTEVAIHSDGFVGYTQHIGSAATTATNTTSNYNFGVGATISALCEAARYYGGVQGDMYPYLVRKTMGTASFKIGSDKIYNGSSISYMDAPAYIDTSDRTMVPLRAVSEALGAEVFWHDNTQSISITKDERVIQFTVGSGDYYVDSTKNTMDTAPVIINGRTYVPLRSAAEALDRNVYWNNRHQIVMIGAKSNPFYNCHLPLVDMLAEILDTGTLPVRPQQEEWSFKISVPELEDENRIKIQSAVASYSPEPENPAENAFDDDLNTRWASTDTCEIVFDLGNVQYVEKIGTAFWKYAERTTAYELHTSTDGESYTQHFSGDTVQGEQFNYTSIGSDVRYIKLIGHGNSINEWVSLLELIPYSK